MRRCGRLPLVACFFALWAPSGAAAQGDGASGTLIDLHGHRSDGRMTDHAFAIRDARGVEHVLADDQPERLLGQRVRLTDGGAASGLRGEVRALGEQRLAPAPAAGPRTLLVVLVTTADAPSAAATADAARSAVFSDAASAGALHEQQSAGATRLVGRARTDGDVTEPLAIATTLRGCDASAIANASDSAARAAGWAVEAYDHVLYVLPRSSECAWAGRGQLPGRRMWSNGTLATRVIAHELGHNLGAHHANSLRCTAADGGGVTLSTTCTSTEYGDPFDVMGLPPVLMSSWHRAQLGQLPAGQELRLRESQTLTLVSSDDFSAAGPRLLLVPLKKPRLRVTSWLAVELRSSLAPFDLWSPGAPVTTGISVRRVPDLTVSEQSQLLDAQPATSDRADAPLQPGSMLRDDVHDISVRLNSVDGRTANVTVTMPTLVDDVPPIPPTFVSASGDTNAVTLSWGEASDDEAIDHFEIERDGAIIGTTTGRSFTDTRVADLRTATYRVVAVDTSANRGPSPPSQVLLPDATPPGVPPGLSATVNAGAVVLAWAAAADNRELRGYRVVRDGHLVSDTAATTLIDHAVAAGPHRYEVSAVDTAGNRGPAAAAEITVVASDAGAQSGAASTVAPAAAPAATGGGRAAPRPRIVLLRRSSRSTPRGRVVVLQLSAPGASSVIAHRGARRIARAAGSRLRVRVAVPRRGVRRTVRVVAHWPSATVSRSITIR